VNPIAVGIRVVAERLMAAEENKCKTVSGLRADLLLALWHSGQFFESGVIHRRLNTPILRNIKSFSAVYLSPHPSIFTHAAQWRSSTGARFAF
jgi:hypothetical protein